MLVKITYKIKKILNYYIFPTDSCHRPLDKEWLANAKEELHEDEKERQSAIESLRSWALQQKWLKTPTGNSNIRNIFCKKHV